MNVFFFELPMALCMVAAQDLMRQGSLEETVAAAALANADRKWRWDVTALRIQWASGSTLWVYNLGNIKKAMD